MTISESAEPFTDNEIRKTIGDADQLRNSADQHPLK
jgi:hypothetical protein